MTRDGSIATSSALALAALILAAPPTLAAEATDEAAEDVLYVSQSTVPTDGDLAPNAEIVGTGQPISVSEAIALAIQNSLDVEVERFAPALAESNAQEAWGAYDPLIEAQMDYDVQKSPNTFALNNANANRERFKGGAVGVAQRIPLLGAEFSAVYAANSSSTRSTIQSFDDQFNSSFFMRARVPLLRGLIWNREWTNVKATEARMGSAREDFRGRVMDVVRSTVTAYWNLVAARDRVRVAQKSLETSRALLEQTKTQYEVGVVSRVEVVEAEAGVADREFEVIRTANQYRNAQDALIDAVLGRELSALTDLQFAPSDDPGVSVADSVDVRVAVETAFQRRPELQSSRKTIERGEFSLKFAKSQRLPQFDVEMEYGFTGLGGDPNPAPTFGSPAPQVDFDDTTNDFFNQNGADSYSVRGVFSIPFPNTSARKRVVRSELDLRRSKTRLARQEQTIVLEVRRAARTLLASAQGIEAAERRRLAAEEQLRAERIRLEHGESTPFEVLQRESDLVEAESQKIDALQAYRSAEIGLERAQGTILDFHSVELDTAAELAP